MGLLYPDVRFIMHYTEVLAKEARGDQVPAHVPIKGMCFPCLEESVFLIHLLIPMLRVGKAQPCVLLSCHRLKMKNIPQSVKKKISWDQWAIIFSHLKIAFSSK